MKLIRHGAPDHEIPGLLLNDGRRIDASGFGSDYDEAFFGGDGLERLAQWAEAILSRACFFSVLLGLATLLHAVSAAEPIDPNRFEKEILAPASYNALQMGVLPSGDIVSIEFWGTVKRWDAKTGALSTLGAVPAYAKGEVGLVGLAVARDFEQSGHVMLKASEKPLNAWQQLVRSETWTEKWPDASGKAETRNVTAEVWTQAMQSTLDAQGALHIPARAQPYYLDGPLVLKSGQKLSADPTAEIRLKPGTNTCMVRNEHVVTLNTKPVPADLQLDTDITVEGGIWTTLAVSRAESNGNLRGHSAKENAAFGTHGVILFQNVRRVSVKNVTIRQSRPFGVHLANAHEFTVENITLEDHRRDGVHVNGPASDGLIRGVQGESHDDNVALNAWEWKNYAPSYGPIERIVIEDITGAPEGVSAVRSIRLLPGVKRFSDGSTLVCPISDITLRRITDIREFKLYDQPNLELGRDNDFSAGIGSLRNIVFENLTFNRPGSIQIHANTDGLTVRDVKLLLSAPADYHLIELGPKSMTYKSGGPTAPEKWTEVFSPDLDCTVRSVSVAGVRTRDSDTDLPIEKVVRVIEQKPNPDYPKTTPKGGTGKGIWIR